MEYEVVIGLEVHAQLSTKTKLFCGCPTTFGAVPNSHTCPVCLGMPGVLPVMNRRAVEYALRMAFATHCTVSPTSIFARKHYFYPDLPKGYQVSQWEEPLATKGYVDIEPKDSEPRRIRLHRIHMEEDAGKSIHGGGGSKAGSFVDLNRAGVPLIEIVTEPDLRTPNEALLYLKALHAVLRYLSISNANMEEGNFRCDANVSLRPKGQQELGVKAEVKNVNSFRFVEKALHYEIDRQRDILESGGKVVQETRKWDSAKGITKSMRGKEFASDYRYFPEPDLLPLMIDEGTLAKVRSELPELPEEKCDRFVSEHGLPNYDASVLTSEKNIADFFEATLELHAKPKIVSNWVMGEVLRLLKEDDDREIIDSKVTPKHLAQLLSLLEDDTISGPIAKQVLEKVYATGDSPGDIVERDGLKQMSDTSELEGMVRDVLSNNDGQVQQYLSGKDKVRGFFVGQVMKATKGKANPKAVNEILDKCLDELKNK